ncbi:MAG TPA: outer membrane beta-barrel protein [Opitutaceae bacterium]|nr:outer membrane beta-barrel protein [Opitutaceae bacterium]
MEPQAGTVWRTLDGPLLSGSGILPGSQVRFRGGSGHMEPYGGIFVGFRVNEFLSFRAGYEDFGATELKVQPPASASMVVPTDFRFRDSAFTFEPVLTWQLAPRVRVRGYWGVAFNRTDRLVQNYQVISPLPVIVVIGGPVSPLPYYDPHVPDRRTLSHLARQGASLAVKLTDRLDLDLGVDHQGLSSFADDAWMIHAGAVYSFDEAKWLENRLYVSTEAGEIWRKLDGPLHSQPGILPGGAVAYRNGSSDRALYSAVGVGVKLSEWLAIEGGYQDLGTTYVMLSEPPGFATFPEYYPPTAFRSRDYAYTLDAVFGWRAGQRVSLYGSAGAAFNYSDVVCETQDFYYAWSAYFGDVRVGYRANSSRSVQARFGAGATINLLSHLDLKLGVRYQKLASFASSAWMTHAGIALNF